MYCKTAVSCMKALNAHGVCIFFHRLETFLNDIKNVNWHFGCITILLEPFMGIGNVFLKDKLIDIFKALRILNHQLIYHVDRFLLELKVSCKFDVNMMALQLTPKNL